ncbi:MAG TPA: FHA domain-containing protein [Acidimicrobiia bacterium]|jgi:pSer/pThr/pTyr-binding forkhead associated (FHA) protein
MQDEERGEPLEEHDPTVAYAPATRQGAAEGQGSRVAGAFRYALVVESGPQAGLTYVLGTGETTVGRSDEADIYLGDVTVSRMHAKFVVDEEGLSVDDLGSTNGTYVNMERFDSRQLHPGDEIIIGKFHLGVVVGNG